MGFMQFGKALAYLDTAAWCTHLVMAVNPINDKTFDERLLRVSSELAKLQQDLRGQFNAMQALTTVVEKPDDTTPQDNRT